MQNEFAIEMCALNATICPKYIGVADEVSERGKWRIIGQSRLAVAEIRVAGLVKSTFCSQKNGSKRGGGWSARIFPYL